ncbi:MAG TPA: transcriptional regulator NrdR [Candidatus Acidoferrum sp.]|nr:transcriptional regulator NrdR [Candidatus Acidoferrum sp.]
MRCPKCGCQDDKVIDSRAARDGSAIRRRRECLKCDHRFTTYEQVEKPRKIEILKRDGRREDFEMEKLVTSLKRACQKRPISSDHIEELAKKIHNTLLDTTDGEVGFREIGERVMNELRALDKIAYIRYASIYRNFEEPDEFLNEIKKLEKPHDTLTIRLPGV